jgi:hypothetical protein
MPVLTYEKPIDPEWRTYVIPARGQMAALPAALAGRPPAPPALRAQYNYVEYSCDAPQAGAELVRQAILFRALYDMWSGVNVVVIRYTVDGVEQTLVTFSGASAHSETRAFQYLEALQAAGHQIEVSGLYTEREPCDGADIGMNCCAEVVANHPLMQGNPAPPVYASFPYSTGTPAGGTEPTYRTGNRGHREAMIGLANDTHDYDAVEEEARTNNVKHLIPPCNAIPFVQNLSGNVRTAVVNSADVADLHRDERSGPRATPVSIRRAR